MAIDKQVFDTALTAFEAWLNSHTKDDQSKLFRYTADKAERKRKYQIDKACSEDCHGFNTKTWFSGCHIHTRCTNCGKTWSRIDVPFM